MSLFTECGILDTNWAGETQALQTGLDAGNVSWDLVPSRRGLPGPKDSALKRTWVAPHTHSASLPAASSEGHEVEMAPWVGYGALPTVGVMLTQPHPQAAKAEASPWTPTVPLPLQWPHRFSFPPPPRPAGCVRL